MADGLLVVISGPSGVGKTTVVARLLAEPGYERAVRRAAIRSATQAEERFR